MNRQSVISTSIRSIGYDVESAILEIEFAKGLVYRYHDVPPCVYEELMSTVSKGEFFHEHIKDRYSYSLV
ncbi:MAG TPA: KTSC domain-containing protein [Usitatibacter sp.]|nr:KTSC domain-containing protein [Usitatibacter sp.]